MVTHKWETLPLAAAGLDVSAQAIEAAKSAFPYSSLSRPDPQSWQARNHIVQVLQQSISLVDYTNGRAIIETNDEATTAKPSVGFHHC
jgi:hypothetical protein